MMGYWGNYGYGPGIGPGPVGGLLFIIVLALILGVVIIAVRQFSGRNRLLDSRNWRSSSALDILKERYAKGEIDTREFEERRKVLTEE